MALLTDNDPILFGAHKGKKLMDVPADYLDWLQDQPVLHGWPEVADYIKRNRKAINWELEHMECDE